MKCYKAIFFDWDGTAVLSRKAPADKAVECMRPLLDAGVPLCIVSGTTYDNIAGGAIHESFTAKQLEHLYLGLGRGAFNYRFVDGKPEVFAGYMPSLPELLKIHQACFDVHCQLLREYDFCTDIVFSRPNYCKIDLMADVDRGERLFLQASEIDKLRARFAAHGFNGGAGELVRMAERAGERCGIKLYATTDAKYLEAGPTGKRDNVNTMLKLFANEYGVAAADCCFWGDEFVELDDGVYGSDSGMLTEESAAGDFFDVSETPGKRKDRIKLLGGGVNRFLDFLRGQAERRLSK